MRKCAETLLEKEDKIDYLINNAGVMLCPDWKTEDGFDMQMGTNHFGHFLFTELVLPLVRKSAASGEHPRYLQGPPLPTARFYKYPVTKLFDFLICRIVIVSSMAHTMATNGISFDDINFENSFNSTQVYAQSKLANVLHAKELAKRLENTGISVYSLHPGIYTILNLPVSAI